jgi:hypothetical protein
MQRPKLHSRWRPWNPWSPWSKVHGRLDSKLVVYQVISSYIKIYHGIMLLQFVCYKMIYIQSMKNVCRLPAKQKTSVASRHSALDNVARCAKRGWTHLPTLLSATLIILIVSNRRFWLRVPILVLLLRWKFLGQGWHVISFWGSFSRFKLFMPWAEKQLSILIKHESMIISYDYTWYCVS